jgi:hypothetical protein
MINHVLGQHRFTKVNLLLPSTTFEKSLAILRETLEMLKAAGLRVKLSKCYFFRTTIEYLSYVISEAGVQPSNLKIEAIDKFPTPQNVHQVRQFLGYFRKCIEKYAITAKPMTILLHKGAEWIRGTAQEKAFSTLNQRLVAKLTAVLMRSCSF